MVDWKPKRDQCDKGNGINFLLLESFYYHRNNIFLELFSEQHENVALFHSAAQITFDMKLIFFLTNGASLLPSF